MRRLVSALLAACLPLLPGCMALGPAVSLGGLVLGGPAQYAGSAYSVCEYGYELAAHRRTPDEVLAAKARTLAALVRSNEPAAGTWETGLDRHGGEAPPVADLNLLANLYGVSDLPDFAPEPAPVLLAQSAPDLSAAALRAAGTAPRAAPTPAALAARAETLEVRAAGSETSAAPVRSVAAPAARGLPAWPCLALVAAPGDQGVDGGWSVRLPVTQPVL